MFEVCKAIAVRLDDLAILDDHESEARDEALLHLDLNVFIHWVGLRRSRG